MLRYSAIRKRPFDTPPELTPHFNLKNEKLKYRLRPMPYVYLLAIIFLMLVVFSLVIIIEKQLPTPLKIQDEASHPETFIAERAYNSLKELTKIGPRIAGSYENEVLAVEVLRKEINSIMQGAHEYHVIELDIQKASGAFNLKFLDGMTNVYRDVQNVIVRIGSRINSPHSLLINCHFDSVVDSPGASDDGAGCAVMLEILRVLSKSNRILKNNIIFLFNGAEENFLPASHGFITQHKWAKEIRAFINLEACGAGGREVLFQAGPDHPWILETYSEEVPYPYASSLAQEIFQSGVIPGDTDYRIFRDFGNLSGLDFAWSANGYVYHTKFDTIQQIPLGSLQRTGDNILALARGMAQGRQLSQAEDYKIGSHLMFFDFLGAFVVRFSMRMADFINLSSVIISLYSVYDNMKNFERTDDLKKRQYIKKLIGCMAFVVLSVIVSIISSLTVAALLTGLSRTMSWYGRPLWVYFLYVIPTLVVSMAAILLHAKLYNKDIRNSPWTLFQLYYDAYQTVWTVVLFLGVLLRLRSSFIPLIWVIFSTVENILKSKLFRKWRDSRWLVLHTLLIGLPFIQSFYLIVDALYLFIPIMGRAGAGSNVEFLVAIMISSFFSLIFFFVVPLVLLVRDVEKIFSLLTGLFLISLAVLILTPLGFPYSGEQGTLAPQRFMIAHTQRTFHDRTGAVSSTSSGYWIANMDVNSPHTVDRHVVEMQNAQLVKKDCHDYLYCGLPYLVPVLKMYWKTHWLPGPQPTILTPVKMVADRVGIGEGERVTLKIEGPTHMGVMFSPVEGAKIRNCSLTFLPLAGPKWNGRKTYFIYYAYGLELVPFHLSLDFEVPPDHEGPVMDLAVTSHYLSGPGKTNKHLADLVSRFPSWTAVTHWTATYESWII